MEQLKKYKPEDMLVYITAFTCIIAALFITAAIIISRQPQTSYDLIELQRRLAANGFTIALQAIVGSFLVLRLMKR